MYDKEQHRAKTATLLRQMADTIEVTGFLWKPASRSRFSQRICEGGERFNASGVEMRCRTDEQTDVTVEIEVGGTENVITAVNEYYEAF